ncbi:hypothetical protein, partial [Aerococcus sp. 1KP-2016]|uniref:hypothetical protein n=1 Tax=Aerococcus sp. 1KP-2016 TaxID=1981982 RepID=UPI001F3CB4FC
EPGSNSHESFHELDCSLKFADLFIVVLTTLVTFVTELLVSILPIEHLHNLVCLLCSVFKGLFRCLAATHISYHLHSTFVNRKFKKVF